MPKRYFFIFALVIAILAESVWIVWNVRKKQNIEQASPSKGTEHSVAFSRLKRFGRDVSQFSTLRGRMRHPDADQGVDVSEHQGDIDWKSVRDDGMDFAIIRGAYRGYTEGALIEDATFAENLKGAKAAGLKVGVYVFSQALDEAEAEEEAEFMISALNGTELELPIYYDWEVVTGTKRADSLSGEQVTKNALAFCRAVESAGYKAGVYFNTEIAYWKYDLSELAQYEFWFARYSEIPELFYDFTAWQYNVEGSVAGISGNVDLNLRFTDYNADSP